MNRGNTRVVCDRLTSAERGAEAPLSACLHARVAGRSRDDFVTLMNGLNLPQPKLIDIAVPANRNLGLPHSV